MSLLKNVSSTLRQKPSSRERLMFFVALAAVAFLFVRTGVLAPMNAKEKLVETLEAGKKEQAELEKRAIATAGKPSKSNEKEEDQPGINWIGQPKLIDAATEALVINAKRNNITLLKFNFSPQDFKEGHVFKPISLTLTGALADLGRYLESTEHLAVPLVVSRLSFEPSSDFANVVTLRVEGGFYAKM